MIPPRSRNVCSYLAHLNNKHGAHLHDNAQHPIGSLTLTPFGLGYCRILTAASASLAADLMNPLGSVFVVCSRAERHLLVPMVLRIAHASRRARSSLLSNCWMTAASAAGPRSLSDCEATARSPRSTSRAAIGSAASAAWSRARAFIAD